MGSNSAANFFQSNNKKRRIGKYKGHFLFSMRLNGVMNNECCLTFFEKLILQKVTEKYFPGENSLFLLGRGLRVRNSGEAAIDCLHLQSGQRDPTGMTHTLQSINKNITILCLWCLLYWKGKIFKSRVGLGEFGRKIKIFDFFCETFLGPEGVDATNVELIDAKLVRNLRKKSAH